MRHATAVVAVAVFAALLVGSAGLALAQDEKPTAEGKVAAYEPGKSIALVEAGKDKKTEFKIDDKTKVEGEVAIGKDVQVWAKEGKAVKIMAKK